MGKTPWERHPENPQNKTIQITLWKKVSLSSGHQDGPNAEVIRPDLPWVMDLSGGSWMKQGKFENDRTDCSPEPWKSLLNYSWLVVSSPLKNISQLG